AGRRLFRRAVHRHLRHLRDRTGGPGHGAVLVRLRPGGDPHADSDWRHGCGDRGGGHLHAGRAADRAEGAVG
ncbi:Transcriptional regulator, y4mF family, partial [Dysosmobacter welbionis]